MLYRPVGHKNTFRGCRETKLVHGEDNVNGL
jgi:hypothetical protein